MVMQNLIQLVPRAQGRLYFYGILVLTRPHEQGFWSTILATGLVQEYAESTFPQWLEHWPKNGRVLGSISCQEMQVPQAQ